MGGARVAGASIDDHVAGAGKMTRRHIRRIAEMAQAAD